jgi:hypothetical protein
MSVDQDEMNDPREDVPALRRRKAPDGFADRVMSRVTRLTPAAPRRPARSRVLRALPVAASLVMAVALFALTLFQRDNEAPSEPPTLSVELELPAAEARTVSVAGDFNEWQNTRMSKGEDGVWRIRLSLPPGRYQYAFVVDEDKWVADPRAATLVDSGYSGANAVLDVSL